MNEIQHDFVDTLFSALDRQINVQGGSPIALVVCGGTALAALGLLSRTTKDVDVLGQVIETKEGFRIHEIVKFPDWFNKAADVVQRDFGLIENWINLGPASHLRVGLPKGFMERLLSKNYGTNLTIYFISREDQIYFKVYAAVDRNDYHLQDLLALNPTEKEIENAAKWTLTQDVSDDFRSILTWIIRHKDTKALSYLKIKELVTGDPEHLLLSNLGEKNA